jgi:co-chaperonin GroES (HSP10)
MRYLPAPEFLLVRQDTPKDRSAGGIFKPDMAIEDTLRGTVLAVGPNIVDYAPGHRVMWGKYAGIVMSARGEEFALCVQLRQQDVLGLIDCVEDVPGAVELTPAVPEAV